MDAERKLPLSHAAKATGSEHRRKQRIINFRATEEEYAFVEEAARNAGRTMGSFIREKLLAAPQTRTQRRARADVAALAELIAELNRIGGSLHQIYGNLQGSKETERAWLQATLALLLRTMKCARAAMGFES